MRPALIRLVLPFLLCLLPMIGAALIMVTVPPAALNFYIQEITKPPYYDILILALGAALFLTQILLVWFGLQWRGSHFDERPDRWISNLGQAAEWFPLLGLLGTVGGILQTFSSFGGVTQPTAAMIIEKYAPAITATGSGLFMAFINILPPWIATVGRDLILTLSGGAVPPTGESK